MKKHIKSRPGLFGMTYYYDENGDFVGKSRPGLFEGTRVYTDKAGKYAGKSRPGFFSKEVFTDTDHNHVISYDALLGEIHYKNGKRIGRTRPGFCGYAHILLETEEVLNDEYYEEFPEEDLANLEDSLEELEKVTEEMENELCDIQEDYKTNTPQHISDGKLKPFTSFVLFLMVVGCIYAIIKFNG